MRLRCAAVTVIVSRQPDFSFTVRGSGGIHSVALYRPAIPAAARMGTLGAMRTGYATVARSVTRRHWAPSLKANTTPLASSVTKTIAPAPVVAASGKLALA